MTDKLSVENQSYLDKMRAASISTNDDTIILKKVLHKIYRTNYTVNRGKNIEGGGKSWAIVDIVEPKFCSSELPLNITVLLFKESWKNIFQSWITCEKG